jgi:hypothetical protein
MMRRLRFGSLSIPSQQLRPGSVVQLCCIRCRPIPHFTSGSSAPVTSTVSPNDPCEPSSRLTCRTSPPAAPGCARTNATPLD